MNMKCFLAPAVLLVVGVLACGAMGDTFLQGLAGPTGLANEGSQGSSVTNDRFQNSPSFIGAPYDWSGVGNNGGSWATMISPSYFLSANHDHPGPGSTVTFHLDNNPNGPTQTYTVDSTFYQTVYDGQGSDLYLGKLTTPVSSSIAKYPVLSLGSDAAYTNMTIYTYGNPNRVGMNNINGDFMFSDNGGPATLHHGIDDLNLAGYGLTRVMYYSYNATGGQGANEAYLEGGDSGGPSFAVWNGSLALLGTHFVDDGPVYDGAPSGDSFVPFYVNQLDANMVGEQVTLSVVPEPVTMVTLLGGLVGLAAHIRKRNRK
jgi:hypothetical protein